MFGSSYGTIFKISTWGESHGKAIGVVIDGCPSGIPLDKEDIQIFLNRRKPGQSRYTTMRKESDSVEILSGVFEGKTTGTPISLMVLNEDHHSSDYNDIATYYRPGHADFNYDTKYGFRDYKGGGRSSGRETIGRVAAGAIASKILNSIGVKLCTYTLSIGPVSINRNNFDASVISKNPVYMPDLTAAELACDYLNRCMAKLDSSGGIIECLITGMPAGIGEPAFEKLDANLAKAVMSIGAIKGFEIGDGFGVAKATGSTNNDAYEYDAHNIPQKLTNHSGGITGGLSDGCDIIFRAAVKPTPSIAAPQKTINKSMENIDIQIKGRHDPVIVPRAVVVVESMAAITLVDMLFAGMTSRIDYIKDFYA